MASLNQRPLEKRDRTNENFKAAKNLLSRCDQIRQRYGADVYIQVRRMHKHYEYTSLNEPSWPKTKTEMERTYPVPVTRTPLDFVSRRSQAPTSHPSSPTRRLRGAAAEEKDAQHRGDNGSSKADSRKAPVHRVNAYHSGNPIELEGRSEDAARCRELVKSDSSKRACVVNRRFDLPARSGDPLWCTAGLEV
ncbi:hypothetical protein CDEST_09253 [Colletotrichum destructivum]|uniref:Uncharacterized protein n=1 Tax=Colletotrichum destructivum TaxID=34406 RepID=A0AAX4ILM6_9PEZI|nr:hypothetical protein CDEST_09253 [Colletotrichum destructivum]